MLFTVEHQLLLWLYCRKSLQQIIYFPFCLNVKSAVQIYYVPLLLLGNVHALISLMQPNPAGLGQITADRPWLTESLQWWNPPQHPGHHHKVLPLSSLFLWFCNAAVVFTQELKSDQIPQLICGKYHWKNTTEMLCQGHTQFTTLHQTCFLNRIEKVQTHSSRDWMRVVGKPTERDIFSFYLYNNWVEF